MRSGLSGRGTAVVDRGTATPATLTLFAKSGHARRVEGIELRKIALLRRTSIMPGVKKCFVENPECEKAWKYCGKSTIQMKLPGTR